VHLAVLAIGLAGPYGLGMRLISAATLGNCVIMFGAGVACAARRVPAAGLFVLAFATLLVSGLLMALRNFGLVPTTFVTMHGIQIGSALEMLLLSLALADRFHRMKQEKAQAQAAALHAQQQLVESLRLQEKVLEQRVAERTDELEAANERLRELALHDPLTGLANRTALYAHVDEALARVHAGGGTLCLLMIDLDGFKGVNDTRGHEAGDAVLVEVAQRLKRIARPQDVVARLGGDEFVIVAEGLSLPEDAYRIAQEIVAAIRVPMAAAPDAPVGASVGIASNRAVVSETEALLHRADTAMYAAKAAGRGKVHWWPEEGVEPARTEVALSSAG
jgi:diguanylate cyclase (GGDEF)-like protein